MVWEPPCRDDGAESMDAEMDGRDTEESGEGRRRRGLLCSAILETTQGQIHLHQSLYKPGASTLPASNSQSARSLGIARTEYVHEASSLYYYRKRTTVHIASHITNAEMEIAFV